MALNMNYLAAPILKERGLQIAHLECTFDQTAMQTVYTVQTACGKTGSFRISPRDVHEAFTFNGAEAMMAAHFKSMEFSDGKPVIPEVQPELTSTEADAGQPESHQETLDSIDAPSESPVDAGGPPSQTKPAWQEQ